MNDMLEGFMAYLETNRLVEFDTRDEGESSFRSANSAMVRVTGKALWTGHELRVRHVL